MHAPLYYSGKRIYLAGALQSGWSVLNIMHFQSALYDPKACQWKRNIRGAASDWGGGFIGRVS